MRQRRRKTGGEEEIQYKVTEYSAEGTNGMHDQVLGKLESVQRGRRDAADFRKVPARRGFAAIGGRRSVVITAITQSKHNICSF